MSGPFADQLYDDQHDGLVIERRGDELHGSCTCGQDMGDALEADLEANRALWARYDRHVARHS